MEDKPTLRPQLRLLTWNVNGVRSMGSSFANWLTNEAGADIICLQAPSFKPLCAWILPFSTYSITYRYSFLQKCTGSKLMASEECDLNYKGEFSSVSPAFFNKILVWTQSSRKTELDPQIC